MYVTQNMPLQSPAPLVWISTIGQLRDVARPQDWGDDRAVRTTFTQRHSDEVAANDGTRLIQNTKREHSQMDRSPSEAPVAGEKGFKGVAGGRVS